VLRVEDQAERAAVEVDAVAGGAVRVVERRGAHAHAFGRRQRVAGGEVAVFQRRAEHLRRHGKERRHHELGEHALERHGAAQVPGPQAKAVLRLEQRLEERQTANVIEMSMREIEVGIEARVLERPAEVADAGAGIEEQELLAAAHFDRRGIAAVARGARAGARDGAAHAPEPNGERGLFHHSI